MTGKPPQKPRRRRKQRRHPRRRPKKNEEDQVENSDLEWSDEMDDYINASRSESAANSSSDENSESIGSDFANSEEARQIEERYQ